MHTHGPNLKKQGYSSVVSLLISFTWLCRQVIQLNTELNRWDKNLTWTWSNDTVLTFSTDLDQMYQTPNVLLCLYKMKTFLCNEILMKYWVILVFLILDPCFIVCWNCQSSHGQCQRCVRTMMACRIAASVSSGASTAPLWMSRKLSWSPVWSRTRMRGSRSRSRTRISSRTKTMMAMSLPAERKRSW